MKRYRTLVVIVVLFLSSRIGFSQEFDRKQLEETIQKAIQKAYPASVRMWGFDTVRKVQISSQFSGVVVSAEGHILTAAHAIIPNRIFKVFFPGGQECLAIGLGRIALTGTQNMPDVAMMKIISTGTWPYTEMGWSSTLKENEACISIAYPESLAQPLPMIRFGRISVVKNRWGFVQSTCAMELGDSGGPLFDYLGRVIGIHSRIDISEELNYEVPVDLYRKYWTALNIAEDYKSLPASEDAVKDDPLGDNITSIAGLENMGSNFTEIGSKYKNSCVVIRSSIDDIEQKILGTIFSVDRTPLKDDFKNNRILISKSSMVGDQPLVEVGENKNIKASVIARDKENDLVLMVIAGKINDGVKLKLNNADTVQFSQLGKFLISPQPGNSARISVIGSAQFTLPPKFNSGYLGAAATLRDGQILLTRVQPNSPAKEADLETGDLVVNINGTQINKPEDFSATLQKYWPEDKITFEGSRGGNSYSKDIVLKPRPYVPVNHPAEKFEGGKSARRDGFNKVFIHDARLKPDECGGPVFDADGHFYGINIARFSRTTSIIIPGAVIYQFIENSMNKQM